MVATDLGMHHPLSMYMSPRHIQFVKFKQCIDKHLFFCSKMSEKEPSTSLK